MEERIQKLMAQAGIASRRKAEEMITQGRVTINGERVTLGTKADPAKDDIRVDGSRLKVTDDRVYIMLNKPMGIVTAVTAQEQEHRRTVRDLVPVKGHLYPVGRLDADSEGLVLLTSDGELAQKLTHPSYEHPKIYDVALVGKIPDEALDIWRRGVVLEEDGLTRPVDIKVLSRDNDTSWIRITMREGKKRQIRRIANMLGYPVKKLIRTQIGTLELGNLKVGEWRYLTEGELNALQSSIGTPKPTRKTQRKPSVTQSTPRAKFGKGIKRDNQKRTGSRRTNQSGNSRQRSR